MGRGGFRQDLWRRDQPDTYDSRRNSSPRRSRDSSRDRGYDRGRDGDRDRDRDRDFERDRDRDRGREPVRDGARDAGWDAGRDRSRERFPNRPPPRGDSAPEPLSSPRVPAPIEIPKGPKGVHKPSPIKHIQSPSKGLGYSTRLDELRSPARSPMASPRSPATRERDYFAGLFLSLLKKSREVGVHEQTKRSLDLVEERREEQRRQLDQRSDKRPDFPSLPELNRPISDAERARREAAGVILEKTTSDMQSSAKNLMTHISGWVPRVTTLEDEVKSLKIKQDGTTSKAQTQSLQALEQQNERLGSQVKSLASLVETMTAKLEATETKLDVMDTKLSSVAAKTPKLEADVDYIMTRSKVLASLIGTVEQKMDTHAAKLAKLARLDDINLDAVSNLINTEHPRTVDKVTQQGIAIAKLKTEMSAIQHNTKTPAKTNEERVETAAAVSNPAPSIAPAPAPAAPINGSPITFPGDDFTSLRIEISMLNERLFILEKVTDKVEEMQAQQAKSTALGSIERNNIRVDLRKEIYNGLENMAKVFSEAFDKETKVRAADRDRLTELEKSVQRLRENPTPTIPTIPPANTEMAEAANTTKAAGQALEPLLSPVPDLVNPSEPAGSIEAIEPLPAPSQTNSQEAVYTGQLVPAGVQGKTEELEKDVHLLQERMQYSEDEIQKVRADFQEQCATLRMMVSTLDTQFNNLTTKELFQDIVGYMEGLYPTARQLQEDIKNMAAHIQQMKQNNRITNDSLRKLEEAIGGQSGQKRALTWTNGAPPGDPSFAPKRQKTGETGPGANASINGSKSGHINGTVATALSGS